MARRSDLRLLVLHGVHLKGVAEVGPIAETIGLREGQVAAAISRLEAERYVQRREGQLAGWGLTPAGRNEHQRLLAEEIDSDGLRPQLERVYRRFLVLNPQVLEVCSQWQVRRLAGHLVRNDHSDADYDHAVIDELLSLHRRAGPLCDRLARVLDRFRPYKPRLDRAVKRIRAGDTDYVAKPIVPSYHTVWFELHEDLLASLGIDRTVEAAG